MNEIMQLNDPQYTEVNKCCPICGEDLEIEGDFYICEDCDYSEIIPEDPNIIL